MNLDPLTFGVLVNVLEERAEVKSGKGDGARPNGSTPAQAFAGMLDE